MMCTGQTIAQLERLGAQVALMMSVISRTCLSTLCAHPVNCVTLQVKQVEVNKVITKSYQLEASLDK